MDILFTLVAFFVLIGIVIAIHEGGHFFVGLMCNIRLLEFSIGMGPKLFQKEFGKEKIKFTLRLIPMGGYVKPLDQGAIPEEEWNSLSEKEKARSFKQSKRWKKALMVFGGPFANFVLALLIYVYLFAGHGVTGLPAIVGEVASGGFISSYGLKEGDEIYKINGKKIELMEDAHSEFVNAAIGGKTLFLNVKRDNGDTEISVDFKDLDLKNMGDNIAELLGFYFKGLTGEIEIKNIQPESGASKAGLLVGDKIVKINGMNVEDINKTLRIVKRNVSGDLDLEVERNGSFLKFNVPVSVTKERGHKIAKIGVELYVKTKNNERVKTFSIGEAFFESMEKVKGSTVTTLVSLKKIVTGEIAPAAIAGPLTIADYSGKSAQRGFYSYMLMIAAISIAVGVFNLIPIPMFDGGHLLQYAIETIRNKNFSEMEMKVSQYIGMGAMGSIFILAITNDLIKYVGFLG